MSEIITHEDFAHICLKIRDGDTNTKIPCCGNCKYYKQRLGFNRDPIDWICIHPRLKTDRVGFLVMQPEDFCSRYTERSE